MWVADITCLRQRGGFAYLFHVTNEYSRKIVGWSLGETLETSWILKELRMALKGAGTSLAVMIHHSSDRGVQYCSGDTVGVLKKEGLEITMAEAGNPCENGIAEWVNGILKDEFRLNRTMADVATARRVVCQAVSAYNTLRPHHSIGLMRPEEKYREANLRQPCQEAA